MAENEQETAEVVRVEVTIEPSWTIDHYTEVIEVEASALAGLEGQARYNAIEKIAEGFVNNECSWGFSELSEGAHE